jgi:histidinol-phosphate aminotransferase
MNVAQLAPDYVRAISPDQPGKPISELAREMGIAESDIVKLASNENPLGMSARAREAAIAALQETHRYPDGNGFELKAALAERYGVGMEQIVLGNGSNDVLELAARVFLTPDAAAVYSKHAFAVYRLVTQAIGARRIEAPAKDYGHDLDAMHAALAPGVRLVFIANPNNPTGSYITHDELRRLHAGLPPDTLMVIDAAYSEYVRRNDYEAGIEMVSQFPNVVMTRTFSKVHGLAGMRIGWTYAPAAVCDVLNRIRGPFNVSMMQQYMGAAAMRDRAHVERSIAHNEKWKNWLTDEIRRLGLTVNDSVANFILIQFPKGGKSAAKADAFLSARGLILRGVANYGLPDALRLTVGPAEANERVVHALREFMGR